MSASNQDTATQAQHAAYHSSAYSVAGAAMMSFTPINQIHQHLCGLHLYAHDPTRSVSSHHYCTHLSKDLHQCVIYDRDAPDARLIGIEYIIPEDRFTALPEEEKKYWHSHKYEVESGQLVMGSKSLVPGAAEDLAERPAMLELHRTYGKTTHTWQYDVHPDLPMGPPALMMSFTADGQLPPEKLEAKDKMMGSSTQHKREMRAGYLPKEDMEREPVEGCDPWLRGQGGTWQFVEGQKK